MKAYMIVKIDGNVQIGVFRGEAKAHIYANSHIGTYIEPVESDYHPEYPFMDNKVEALVGL